MTPATLTLRLREIPVSAQRKAKGRPLRHKWTVDHCPLGGAAGLVDDARGAAVRGLILAHGGPVRDPAEFDRLAAAVKPEVPGAVRRIVVGIAPALVEYAAMSEELRKWEGPAIDDMRAQLEFYLPRHAITVHGMERLQHLPRYIEAMRIRLADMSLDPERDAGRQGVVDSAKASLRAKVSRLPAGREKTPAYKEILWRIEELRVSLFAQRLGTAKPVSQRRVEKMIEKLA